jgi:hypothetical protein
MTYHTRCISSVIAALLILVLSQLPCHTQPGICADRIEADPGQQAPPGKYTSIVCSLLENNPTCTLNYGRCEDIASTDPAGPLHSWYCVPAAGLGGRCDCDWFEYTVTYNNGIPYCRSPTGSNPCDTGCSDWDTEASERSASYMSCWLGPDCGE